MFNKKLSHYFHYIILSYIFLYFLSCSSQTNEVPEKKDQDWDILMEKSVEVETILVESQGFQKELISNGKLLSGKHADLRFMNSGVIKGIFIQEGQLVSAGQLVATIDDAEIISSLKQIELDMQRSKLEYDDHLLRLGYRLDDTAGIDKEVKIIARLKSGITLSEINLEKVRLQFEHTRLVAPFDGYIANLKAKPYNSTSSYDYVCTIVNNNDLIAEFKVLEQELSFVKKGGKLVVTPFSMPNNGYNGIITSINPIVDNSGMVMIKATIKHDGQLLSGMGVKVKLIQNIPNQIAVPKEAVLDRQNRKVVFTFEDDSLAKWNYVEIYDENSSHYAIKSGLKIGDEVIVKGNFNLSHDKKVNKSK